ncbi:hypothetical protein EYF80_020446 [Liparis tanakae]|uniref:Uncharacterized protein n=1 Tax=Liparis tanakae TaxID=230148 RepID=A0A4Z2HVH5_9TELE|nr:hypothetical protein EYF80_020446 [Liparis tanakae]
MQNRADEPSVVCNPEPPRHPLPPVGHRQPDVLYSLGSDALPVQEVVFVQVSDPGSDLTGHPLQLQQLSISEQPVLLRQIAPQIPLQKHT